MAHMIALDGDLTVKEENMNEVKNLVYDFGCDIRSATKNQLIFSFYDEAFEDEIEAFVSSIKDFIIEGVIDVLDDDEAAYSAYIFHDGKYEYVNGLSLVYYPGHADLFVEKLPKEVIDAVLKKYGDK